MLDVDRKEETERRRGQQPSPTTPYEQPHYRLWDVGARGGGKVPDNFTDATFLSRLVVNANVTRRAYWTVAWDSQVILQELCVSACVPAAFAHLKGGRITVARLLLLNLAWLATATALLLAVAWKNEEERPSAARKANGGAGDGVGAGEGRSRALQLWRPARQCFLLLAGLYNMSPLYQKLTLSISSDTIGASSSLLLLLHLYLHDYCFKRTTTETLAGAVSLGAAIAASVLLASRLDTTHQVFSYLSFALGQFVLFPFFRKHLLRLSRKAHLLNTLLMLGATLETVRSLSGALAVALAGLALFTAFLVPWALISVEKHKVQISGPWDEAKLH